ncbi:MAG TPA: beta-N-acetylhexosaminidase [Chryseosolibacter sp.]|nr:beta-N-acetylhexosaminidase [Chryseosolibacter sp.]
MRYICLLALLLSFSCAVRETQSVQTPLHIIPRPVSVVGGGDNLQWDETVAIIVNGDQEQLVAELLQFYLKEKNITADISQTSKDKDKITLALGDLPDSVNGEGYRLTADDKGVRILASSGAGLFYGVQTLMQLIPAESTVIPFVDITDYPRFPYRGMHLDVGRHMFSVNFIKKYIDLLARHKFNTFHWHLTEDQGWRIEIKKYPKLQEVAAFRKETVVGRASTRTRNEPHEFDGQRYGGYYTTDEIREVISFASARFVTIIPEIELPGHAMAALAAYPHLGCTGGPYETATTWGIFPDVYCAGKDETFTFLQDVLDEVIALFPSRYIHIGGDEVFNNYFKTSWETCPHCKKRMAEEGLQDPHELQSYFIRRVEKYLNSKGKQIIGWDEILEGGLAPNATVMSWRGEAGGIAAARQQHDVIMTPEDWFYLDHAQDTVGEEPVIKRGYTPLKEVYAYDPVPAELTGGEARHILGAQGNVWTEYMKSPDQVEYMTYPRACAIAEVVWSPKAARDYNNFLQRMQTHVGRLKGWNVNYSKHLEKEFAGR